MDIEIFLIILVILSAVKGLIGFGIYWWLAHRINKELAGWIVFMGFTILPFLAWLYSEAELLEKLTRLGVWTIEGFISLGVGLALIFLYEIIFGKRRAEKY